MNPSKALLVVLLTTLVTASCEKLGSTEEPEEQQQTATGSVAIAQILCTFTHTDGFGNRYYKITYNGTATASEGVTMQLSSLDYGAGTQYITNCGGWTLSTWGGSFPACQRKAGQPESVNWTTTSDLWIANRDTRHAAQLISPNNTSLQRIEKTIRCNG